MAEKHPPSPKRGDDTLSLGRLQVKPAMRDMVRFMVVLCEKWYKKVASTYAPATYHYEDKKTTVSFLTYPHLE